jgi:copper chaperone
LNPLKLNKTDNSLPKQNNMSTIKLKTNVKCGACVQAITPQMNELGVESWEVNLQDPERILTVNGDVSEKAVQEALLLAGYQGKPI